MKQENNNPRLGRVGGQAVLEGVMMKAGDATATACRLADGSITLHRDSFVSLRKKNKFCNLPLVRGVVNFVEMLSLSMKTLNISAEAMGDSMGEETKFEKWLREKLHINALAVASVIGVVLGVVLSVGLFIFLPRFLSGIVLGLFGDNVNGIWYGLFEGVLKVLIFIGYLLFCSLIKDMRRVFAYHGAEHKSVACYEAGDELTPENAKRHTRFHPRCGTSFMFVMILLGIFVSVLLNYLFPSLKAMRWGSVLYTLIKLAVLPVVVGLGFEFIMYAGKHNNLLVRMLSAPGLWMQRITTKEPTDDMLECAITALKCAMPDEFPDFDPATYDRSPKAEPAEGTDTAEEAVDTVETVDDVDAVDGVAVTASEEQDGDGNTAKGDSPDETL